MLSTCQFSSVHVKKICIPYCIIFVYTLTFAPVIYYGLVGPIFQVLEAPLATSGVQCMHGELCQNAKTCGRVVSFSD